MLHELKLIQIHTRRKQILEKQRAVLGPQAAAATIDLEIEEINQSVSEIETNLRRRLQSLLEKAAVYGLNTPPEVSIEIEDIQGYFDQKREVRSGDFI